MTERRYRYHLECHDVTLEEEVVLTVDTAAHMDALRPVTQRLGDQLKSRLNFSGTGDKQVPCANFKVCKSGATQNLHHPIFFGTPKDGGLPLYYDPCTPVCGDDACKQVAVASLKNAHGDTSGAPPVAAAAASASGAKAAGGSGAAAKGPSPLVVDPEAKAPTAPPTLERLHWEERVHRFLRYYKPNDDVQRRDAAGLIDMVHGNYAQLWDTLQRNHGPEPHECPGCRKIGLKYQRCSRCKAVHYCGGDCQKAHWPEHKPHCHKPSA